MAEAGDSGAGPSDPQDPMVGRVIDGRYLLERKLGQGGMGKVYLARQVRMNRPVAVKVVHAEHSSDPDLRARFLREAVALAQVSHPNVLLAHDNGVTEDGLLYLVTELLEGHPLDRLVAASPHRRLPLAPTLSILRQLALALEAVHPHLIHRDLKPHNVMVRSEPEGITVKLLDFGIVRPNTGSELTGTGIIGTPAYMSPEQITQQPDLDPRSDLYSLGIIAYELVTGAAPFRSERYFEVLSAHLSDTPAPIPEERDTERVPAALSALISRLLAKDPAERPSSATEVRTLLDEIDVEVTGERTLSPELMASAGPISKPRPTPVASSGAPVSTQSSWASYEGTRERPLIAPPTGWLSRLVEDRRLVPGLLVILILLGLWGLLRPAGPKATPLLPSPPNAAVSPGESEAPTEGSPPVEKTAVAPAPPPKVEPSAPPRRPQRGPVQNSDDTPARPRITSTPSEPRNDNQASEGAAASGWRPPRGMAAIGGGDFRMGCGTSDRECRRNETPVRTVAVETFALDLREVTVGEYRACRAAGRCPKPSGGRYCNWNEEGRESHPMNCVNWREARAFCAWRGKRLPTEAEWEKAARGASGRKYPWGTGRASCRYAVLDDGRTRGSAGRDTDGCGENSTAPVGSKPAGRSPYGIFDMVGNVEEWTLEKVARGCGWTEAPRECRASRRRPVNRGTRHYTLGFRCATSPTR